MEYLLVVGFALLMLIPIVVIYGSESNDLRAKVNNNQAQQIAKKVADAAETVYYLGTPSQTTIKVYMPYDVQNISIDEANDIITFVVRDRGSDIELPPEELDMNITGSIDPRPGIKFIRIKAEEGYVNITSS